MHIIIKMPPIGYWSILSIANELTVVCKGALDLTNVELLRDEIAGAVVTHAAESVILDWTRVDFVDSRALALPLALRRTFSFPIIIRVIADSQPARVLKMTSLDRVFSVDFVPNTEPSGK